MKIKSLYSDFQVTENPNTLDTAPGQFSFYRLSKTGQTTLDAFRQLQAAWGYHNDQLSFGGLKDRHAVTIQYFTIWNGPKKDYTLGPLEIKYLGTRTVPYRSSDIQSNHFEVIIRDLPRAAKADIEQSVREVQQVGCPNYFDDQRFGSVGPDKRFIAKEIISGNSEAALKLALIGEYEHDRAGAKREKQILKEHWGDWQKIQGLLSKSRDIRVFRYLTQRRSDFLGAMELLRPELQGLYFSAYQSYIWNRTLSYWLEANLPEEARSSISTRLKDLAAPRRLPENYQAEWKTFELPYPSARLKPLGTESWLEPLKKVMAEEGFPLEQMKTGVRKLFFSKGVRKASMEPQGLKISFAKDENHPERIRLQIGFDLPPGSYATMILKRILNKHASSTHLPEISSE